MTGKNLVRKLSGLLLLMATHLCQAACTSSSSAGSFGTLSSFTLASTAQTIETGSGFTCANDSILRFLSSDTITATLASSAGESGDIPNMTSSNGAKIPYSICSTSGCTQTYTIGQSITWNPVTILALPGLFDATDGTLPLYMHTSAGLNVPAGTYTDTLTINWNYTVCVIGLLGICVYTTGSSTSTVNLTAIVTNDCTIEEAPDVSFGSAALPADFSSVASALTILCTKNAAYTVNLSSSNPVSGDWRQMSSEIDGSTHYLLYQLYQADGTAWTPENDQSETGTGEDQTVNYTAKVDSSQTNQPAGSYTDTVTVTVTY